MLVILIAIFTTPATVVDRLDAPCYAVRAAADRQLRAEMTYPRAVILEAMLNAGLPPESGRRVRAALEAFWAIPYSLETMPHIDALTNPRAARCTHWLTLAYLAAACQRLGYPMGPEQSVSVDAYRLATLYLLNDVRRRTPPEIMRRTLAQMDRRTQVWEISQGSPRRLPIGPGGPP